MIPGENCMGGDLQWYISNTGERFPVWGSIFTDIVSIWLSRAHFTDDLFR